MGFCMLILMVLVLCTCLAHVFTLDDFCHSPRGYLTYTFLNHIFCPVIVFTKRIALLHKYASNLHQINTVVVTIPPAITLAKFHLFSTAICRLVCFVHVIYSSAALPCQHCHTAEEEITQPNEQLQNNGSRNVGFTSFADGACGEHNGVSNVESTYIFGTQDDFSQQWNHLTKFTMQKHGL